MSTAAPASFPPLSSPLRLGLADLGRALVMAGTVFLLVRVCLALPREHGRLAIVWLSNAWVLTTLLRSPLRRWPWLIAGAVAGNFSGSLVPGNSPDVAAALALSNALEYGLAALALRRLFGRGVRLDRGRHLLLLVAVSTASALCAGGVSAVALWLLRRDPLVAGLRMWGLTHVLSLLMFTPCLLILTRWREHAAERPLHRRSLAMLALLVAVDAAVFAQSGLPLLFLAPSMLLFVTVEAGVLGAALGVLATAAIAVPATLLEQGPVSLVRGVHAQASVLQLFLAVCLFTSLPVASLQARRRRSETEALAEAARARQAEAMAAASEAKYRLLADKVSDVIAVFDLTGRFSYLSPSVLGMTGYAAEEVVGRRAREFIHPDDYPRVHAAMAAKAAGAARAGVLEYRFQRKDGAWIWVEVNPQLVFDAQGQPLEVVDLARDITARKALEQQLCAARAQADAAAAAKAEFLANMSHELRTPLTAVLGFAGLIADQPELSDATRGYVERVRTAGTSLLATVNDVLDFSRLEAGGLELAAAPTDVAALGRDLVALLADQAQAKGLFLRLTGDPALPARLDLDQDRLRQVLINLLANAVKFTERGGVELALAYDPAAGRLGVQVVDTGPGVALADQPLLFQRFSQVDASSTRRHGGAGLGLAICRGLVEAMGGRIGVDSAPGAGARFHFDLPAPVSGEAAGADPAAATTPALPPGLRVLVADDHAVNRELVRLVLAPHGVAVSFAADGLQAVEAAALAPFDVIFMDLRMPELDGEAATRRIRQAPGPNRFTPVLAFTASPAGVDAALFDGAVPKPLSPGALLLALAEAVGAAPSVTGAPAGGETEGDAHAA